MLCLVLALFCRAEYIELTSENVDQYIGGDMPIFVKFYSPDCPHCAQMAPDFDDAAEAFKRVRFGGVDCTKEKEVCEAHNVDGYPTLYLYLAGKKEGIEFEGTRGYDQFCTFIENYTRIRPHREPSYVADVTPLNIEKRLNESPCAFMTFYAPWCGHCQHFLPELAIAAESFLADKNVTFGRVNCDQFQDLCTEYGVDGYPAVMLFKKGKKEPIMYESEHYSEAVVEFVNEECGTQREVGGLLNSEAGCIPEANDVVKEFLEGDKEAAMAKMRTIKGAEFYVRIMDRYLQKGKEQVEKDVNTMRGLLDEKKGSWQSLDGMKRRYNVFVQFVETEKPQQMPESEYFDDDEV